MIMKHWMHCPIVVTHGRLREWQIFKKRQGDHPNAETGEVCFDINCYGRAVLMPGVTTEPAAHDEEFENFFVIGGEGLVQVGRSKEAIRTGSSIAIPAGLEHRLRNTGEEELELVFCRRPHSSSEAETPTDAAEILTLLERHFNDLVSAYDKTEIGIYGVYTNAERVSARIEALKKALDR